VTYESVPTVLCNKLFCRRSSATAKTDVRKVKRSIHLGLKVGVLAVSSLLVLKAVVLAYLLFRNHWAINGELLVRKFKYYCR